MVRNDRLGDFALALPSFALLKRSLPEATIAALVPEYTRPVAELAGTIDEVVDDPGPVRGGASLPLLVERLRAGRFDAAVALFSTGRTARALRRAGIPYRLGPATKLAQLLYTHRLVQRRSRSEKPEWVYDLELAARLLDDCGREAAELDGPPWLRVPPERAAAAERALRERHGLDRGLVLVLVHPGSGGSAPNLSLEQYAALCRALESRAGHALVISAGPGEEARAEELARSLAGLAVCVHRSEEGLARFVDLVAAADLFVAGSTGPLHLAGALDRPTAAFYPRHRSGSRLRWQTLNRAERRLAFEPPPSAGEREMSAIDPLSAARMISRRFLA